MPPAVAAVSAVAGSIISAGATVGAAVGGIFGASVTGALIGANVASFGLQAAVSLGASRLLGPKAPSAPKIKRDATLMVRATDAPRRVIYGETRVGGIWIFAATTGDSNEFLHMVLVVGDGPVEGIDGLYLDDAEVVIESVGTDANGRTIWGPAAGSDFVGLVELVKYDGAAGQPADARLVADTDWTSSHTLDGVAYVALRLKYEADAFPQGLPAISFRVRGRNDIYDPRTAASAYTTNAALALNHYLTGAAAGPGADYATEIDEDALIAAANLCDEAVPLKAGGTEKRYTVNGFVDTAANPEDVVADLKAAMAGSVVYVGGRFVILAGGYIAPTVTLTDDMIVSPVELSNRLPRRDRFNEVRGLFVSPANRYQPTDFPAVTGAAYVTEDGDKLATDLALNLTASAATAQRLAKIELEASRREKRVQFQTNLRGLKAQAGNVIALDFPRFGWEGKTFLVESSAPGPLPGGGFGVSLALREFDAGVFDWDAATDEVEVDDAPDLDVGEPKVDDLTASPAAGSYPAVEFPKSVTLSTMTAGATIRWSKTATPGTTGDGTQYTGAISVAAGETLYARAFKTGLERSDPFAGTYTAS